MKSRRHLEQEKRQITRKIESRRDRVELQWHKEHYNGRGLTGLGIRMLRGIDRHRRNRRYAGAASAI